VGSTALGQTLCNSLRIENGSYDAQGGQFGAGIGSGYSSFRNGTWRVNFVMIVDGNVTAKGGCSSGIGSGYGNYGNLIVLPLAILNGNITSANSDDDSGYGYYGKSSVFNLTIPNGNVSSTNSGYGGSGCGRHGNLSVFNLMILNGSITSTNSVYVGGSGIGSGYGRHGNSNVFNLTILNGNITVTSFSDSGIGTGSSKGTGKSNVENIWLKGDISLDI
jgi:hypothetical protein